jgi:hypothetical protein
VRYAALLTPALAGTAAGVFAVDAFPVFAGVVLTLAALVWSAIVELAPLRVRRRERGR